MNSTPLVSIISSVYNVERFIEKMVLSLTNQTYKHLEIVLIDNASTDSSGRILDDLATKDKRIKVVHLDKNRGPSGGINEAIKLINGTFFTHMDSDDWMDLDCVEKVISQCPDNVDYAIWKFKEHFEDGKITEPFSSFKTGELTVENKKQSLIAHLLFMDGTYDNYIIKEVGTPWMKLYRTEKIKGLLHDTDFAVFEDYLFNIKAIKKMDNFFFVDNTYYNLRRGTVSYTSSKSMNLKKANDFIVALDKIKEEISPFIDSEIVHDAWLHFSFNLTNYIFVLIFPHFHIRDVKKMYGKKTLVSLKKVCSTSIKVERKSFKIFIKRIALLLPLNVFMLYNRIYGHFIKK